MKKKVLHLLPSYNIYGGTPKKTLDLIKDQEIDSYVITYSDDHLHHESIFNASCLSARFLPGNLLQQALQLHQFLRVENVDIIQTQFARGMALALLIRIFRPSTKIIICCVSPFNEHGVRGLIEQLSLRTCDRVVCVSRYVLKKKSRKYRFLKNTNRVKVIYNGTSISASKPENTFLGNSSSLKLLNISGMVQWKNQVVLIEAMKILHHEYKIPVFLTLIGDGPDYPSLKKIVEDSEITHIIEFLGYKRDVTTYLKKSHVYLHPATHEGFGVAVIEAIRSGRPVIAANRGALPELVVDGENGFVIDANNPRKWAQAIYHYYANRDLLFKHGQSSILLGAQYSESTFRRNYNELYNEV